MTEAIKNKLSLKATGVFLISLVISIIAFNAVVGFGVMLVTYFGSRSNTISALLLLIFSIAGAIFSIFTFKKIRRYLKLEIEET